MDLIPCVVRLRNGVTWKNNIINGFSLETIAKTYQHEDDLPTLSECEAVWEILKAEYTEEQVVIDGKAIELVSNTLSNLTFTQAETWIDDNVTDLASIKLALKKITRLMLAIRR